MPDPALYCEVRTEGGTYRDWLTVVISQSFDDPSIFRNFRLTCAEPSTLRNLRLKPGDRVDIALAGNVVIQEGYIVNRQAAYDAHRHGVQIDGYSKAGQITKASVDSGTGQYRGYTLDAIANDVLKQHGIKFRMENPPQGANEKFPQVMVRYGETPFDIIHRLCRQRGLWIRADANGDIVAGAKQGGGGIRFEEGVNILSANASIAMPSVQSVIGRSQQPGSDSLFGKKAAEIQAEGKMGGPEGQKYKFLAEMPLSQTEMLARTNMEMQAIEASLLRVSVTYRGWLKPETGGLWDLTESVIVKSPMLFPTESGELSLKLWGYTYVQDAQSGTQTTIELVNERAFTQRFPDATKDDGFFNPSATPATPSIT